MLLLFMADNIQCGELSHPLPRMNFNGSERRERILEELLERRQINARDLANSIGVSEATVRRDLKQLADEGQLELIYGGATIRRHSDLSFHARATRNIQQKQIIGRLAADLVHDDAKIFLDSGTTTHTLVPYLKRKHGLSVIVNSARLALELDSPGLSVILLGGQYRADRMDTVGAMTESVLEKLRGYICFIGADGLSMDVGLCAADSESANLYRLAVRNATQTILLADNTKFQAPSLCQIVEWGAISQVVTDRMPDEAWSNFLSSRGIPILCPPPESVVSVEQDSAGAQNA